MSDLNGYTYVVASRGRSQVEMEQLVHDVSTLLVLYYWLLSTSRFNMQSDSFINRSDQSTVHFLTVLLKNGPGNALESMHVNS